MTRLLIALAIVALAGAAGAAAAHEVRPALLQITQRDAHRYEVLWKQPVNGEVAVHLVPRLSGGALEGTPGIATVAPSYALKFWNDVSDEGGPPLDGQTLSVDGLDKSITDVLVTLRLTDGRSVDRLLNPRETSMRLDLSEHAARAAGAFLILGIEHILTGADHLLFVFSLMLLVRRSWTVLKTITAFTAAHSVTLAATTLGWIHIRSAVVEALVALSIVVLAVELVRNTRGEAGVTSRFPWLIAFAFGLLHGCAFAGALAEVGLPREHIPLALFLFNVGVEIGQIAFIAVVCIGLWLLQRLFAQIPAWTHLAAPYAIGTFASFWFIERFMVALSSQVIQT